MRSLGAGFLNGVPIINNRSYTGVITLGYDQPAVIAGAMSRSEQQSLRGLPGLSRIPLLGASNKQRDDDELLVVITPHVLRSGPTRSDSRVLALPKTD
jgi:Flp pilus assembly secretin CpaC